MPESLDDEECEHDFSSEVIHYMGSPEYRYARICIYCDFEDDSEPDYE